MALRQPGECLDHGGIGDATEGILGDGVTALGLGQTSEQGIRIECEHGRSFPDAIDLGVAQDRQQPGSGVPTIESVDGTVGTQQRVLHQVLGVMGVTRHPHGHGVHELQFWHHVATKQHVALAIDGVGSCGDRGAGPGTR